MNMDGMQMGWIIGAAAAVAFAAVLLVVRRRGHEGQRRRVTGILKKYAALRGYKVLTDVDFAGKDGTLHVDNLLVGYFGLLFVSVQTENQDYYGAEKDEYWSIVNEKKATKVKFPNPLNVNLAAMDALRRTCSKNDVYNVQMEQVVVFTSRFKKNSLNVKDTLPVVNVRRLGSMLNKSRFEKDNGVDVDRLVRMVDLTRAGGPAGK